VAQARRPGGEEVDVFWIFLAGTVFNRPATSAEVAGRLCFMLVILYMFCRCKQGNNFLDLKPGISYNRLIR